MRSIGILIILVLLCPIVGAQQNFCSKHCHLGCNDTFNPNCIELCNYVGKLKNNRGYLGFGSAYYFSNHDLSLGQFAGPASCFVLFDLNGDTTGVGSLNLMTGGGATFVQTKDSSMYCIYRGRVSESPGPLLNMFSKFSTEGRLLWQRPSTPGLFPSLPSLTVDRMLPFGETGISVFMSSNDNLYMVQIDSSGRLINTYNLFGPRGGRFTYAEPTPTGGYLLSYRNGISNWAMETDSAFQVIWETEMYRPRYTNGINEGAMLQTPDGGYYHIFNKPGGRVQGQTLFSRAVIRKFDRFFQLQWLDSSESSAYLPGYIQQDGTLLILQRRLLTPHVLGESYRVWKKYRSNGSLEWEKLLDGRSSPQRDEYEYYHGIHLGNGDGVFVGTLDQGNSQPLNTGRDFLITRMRGVGLRFDPRTRITGLSALDIAKNIFCSPNPSTGPVQWFGLPPGRHSMFLINAKGQTVHTQMLQAGSNTEFMGLPSGIYHWQLPALGAKGKLVLE